MQFRMYKHKILLKSERNYRRENHFIKMKNYSNYTGKGFKNKNSYLLFVFFYSNCFILHYILKPQN